MAYTFTRTGAQIEAIHNTVDDPKSNTQFSDDIRTIAGEYRGLWPDTGGSANKGDTYQTQVSGTPTGQYFTALQDTTSDPVGGDVNWRAVVSFSSISGENLISNAFFEFAGSVTSPPDATPRDYLAGDELFQGVFAVGALTGVTYIDGKLNGTGQLYVDIYKAEKQKLSTVAHVASIASSDGLPVESGASFVDSGDYWRVTFDMSDTFSVKFEQGSVATGHDVSNFRKTKSFPYIFNDSTYSDLAVYGVSVGDLLVVEDYAPGNNSGVLFFKAVQAGTGIADGGKYIDAGSLQLEQNLKKPFDPKAWGARGNGTDADDSYINNCFSYVSEGAISFSPGVYPFDNKVTKTNASNVKIYGNGAALKNRTDLTNAEMLEFSDSGALLNHTFTGFKIDNDGYRSRSGQIRFVKPNDSTISDINGNSNSFASTLIEVEDPFNSTIESINYEAAGNGIAVLIKGESLNLSTNDVRNIFCNAGTAVFLGAEPNSGSGQLIETTTLTNIHALRASGATPLLADEENVNGSSSGQESVFVGVGPSASFNVGMKILMGDVGRLEHNYIENITGTGFLELRYPIVRSAAAGSRVVAGDIGAVISGQSTYNTTLINPHVESLGIGIFTSDTKSLDCVGLFTSNSIITVKGDALEEATFKNTSSFASANSVALFDFTDIVSLGTGRKTNRINIDGITDIGATVVPQYVRNTSGNRLMSFRAGSDADFISPTLINSWANGSPGNREVAGYNKDRFGTVKIRGYLNGGGAGTVAFVLPVGFRPSAGREFICASSGTSVGRVLIEPSGDVTILNFTGSIDLGLIDFRVEI